MQACLAVEVQNDEQLLIWPDPQLSGSLTEQALLWRTNLIKNLGIRGIRNIEDQYTCIWMTAVRTAAYISIDPINRQPGVHPAIKKRRMTEQLE
jgi:hypothetical protein